VQGKRAPPGARNWGTAVIDIESLLAETPESPPCGPDLEYDAAYLEFDQLLRGRIEQQFGATVFAAEETAWGEVLVQGAALLKRSKDLRIASVVVRALVRTEGFAGLQPGLRLIHGLVDRFWEHIHPGLDADDPGDPMTRMNALGPLVDPLVLLRDLRDAPLVRSRQHGEVFVRDIEVSLGRIAPRDKATVLSLAQIEAVLAGVALEDAAAMARVPETLAAAKALASLLDDKVGPERAPDFKALLTTLHTLVQVCGKYVVAPAVPEVPDAPAAGSSAPAAQPISGDIRSRDDVLQMIDKIVQYLERHEPTNPAPLLLKRGKRFMSMSFVDIFKEISPDNMATIDAIVGPAQEPK
jgi:type VI secretion system protein ImpA